MKKLKHALRKAFSSLGPRKSSRQGRPPQHTPTAAPAQADTPPPPQPAPLCHATKHPSQPCQPAMPAAAIGSMQEQLRHKFSLDSESTGARARGGKHSGSGTKPRASRGTCKPESLTTTGHSCDLISASLTPITPLGGPSHSDRGSSEIDITLNMVVDAHQGRCSDGTGSACSAGVPGEFMFDVQPQPNECSMGPHLGGSLDDSASSPALHRYNPIGTPEAVACSSLPAPPPSNSAHAGSLSFGDVQAAAAGACAAAVGPPAAAALPGTLTALPMAAGAVAAAAAAWASAPGAPTGVAAAAAAASTVHTSSQPNSVSRSPGSQTSPTFSVAFLDGGHDSPSHSSPNSRNQPAPWSTDHASWVFPKSHLPEIQMIWPLCITRGVVAPKMAVKLSGGVGGRTSSVGNLIDAALAEGADGDVAQPAALAAALLRDTRGSGDVGAALRVCFMAEDESLLAELPYDVATGAAVGPVPPCSAHSSGASGLGVVTAFAFNAPANTSSMLWSDKRSPSSEWHKAGSGFLTMHCVHGMHKQVCVCVCVCARVCVSVC